MNAVLRVIYIQVDPLGQNRAAIKVVLENVGKETVGPGTLIAKQILKAGSLETADFFCPISLAPGEKTKLSQLLPSSIRAIDFSAYNPSDGGLSIPVSGVTSWWQSPWSLKASVEETTNIYRPAC